MPVADFAGERNWGYDGVSWFAPAHAYGHPDDLRALVDAAHQAGLAVILDVVYNHFGPDGNYLHAYVGDYLDEAEKTPWGGAIRYGHPDFKPLRELVVSNPAYWMSEFHIDGFRLDATHAIVDASPRHMLQELTESIHRAGGYAIAEDPRNDVRLVAPVAEGGFGFDAVWADDFHHIVRVSNTAEAESYLADFTGSLHEAVDALRNGWFYRGQFSKFASAPRGTECAEVCPEAFVHCTSNHDQTGNHAFGERLCHRIPPPAQRAADALLCLTPYTPMLFMGQEWGASTPFLFFTDHNAELGRLIIEGRREEFKHFAAFSDEAVRKTIPNPQALSSFEASKLLWDERERGPHACTLALFRAFLGLRRREPAFRPTSRDTWRVEELAMGIGALIHSSAQTEWVVLFDLRGGHQGDLRQESIFQTSGITWSAEIATNEERFGGSRPCAVNLETMIADFTDAETVVLRGIRG
jgi:maltooligosyltrehalose trehalohydrolase